MNYSILIDFIKQSSLSETERQIMLTKIQDANVPEEEKKRFLLDFVNAKEKEINQKIDAAMGPIIQKAKDGMDAAEKELSDKLDALEKESNQVADQLDKDLGLEFPAWVFAQAKT